MCRTVRSQRPFVTTMRWVFGMRRPSSSSGSQSISVSDSLGRRHEPDEFIHWIWRRLFSSWLNGAAICVNRFDTDRRSSYAEFHGRRWFVPCAAKVGRGGTLRGPKLGGAGGGLKQSLGARSAHNQGTYGLRDSSLENCHGGLGHNFGMCSGSCFLSRNRARTAQRTALVQKSSGCLFMKRPRSFTGRPAGSTGMHGGFHSRTG
jgi:hypothetical protein